MSVTRDKKTGKFERKHQVWSPERWNDGFLNNKGRFIVYNPGSKNVLYEGYTLRSYAVWEYFKKRSVPKGSVLHHINNDKLDDRIENLKLIRKKTHDHLHRLEQIKRTNLRLKCIYCNKMFLKPQYRLRSGHVGKFCSLDCYYKMGGRWYKRRLKE